MTLGWVVTIVGCASLIVVMIGYAIYEARPNGELEGAWTDPPLDEAPYVPERLDRPYDWQRDP